VEQNNFPKSIFKKSGATTTFLNPLLEKVEQNNQSEVKSEINSQTHVSKDS
jgi:hypothetical protein